jgi:hypothetical protein
VSKLTSFFRSLRIGKVLAVFLAGILLVVTTACNSGDVRGARPDNLPVQAGGANNPAKGGGDGYTNYKTSTDPKANTSSRGDRADLPSFSGQLIAAGNVESNASDLIYPGSGATDTDNPNIGPVGPAEEDVLKETIPAQPQPIVNRTDPNTKILEKAGEAFKDSARFLEDTAKTAGNRPEMQSNPTRH